MLRSLLCLTLAGDTSSFTKWVGKLRFHPLFAVLSGFEGRTPGVGTFYDFTARLFPERTDPIVRKPISKPKDSDQEKHKNRPLRTGIVQQLVTTALDNKDQPLPAFPALGLNLLLKPVVLRSNDLGLLSSSNKIDLAGDGTKFKTGARPVGHKLCD